MITQQKRSGAFYTPENVAETLVRWAVRRADDLLLDPSCGDGRFLAAHSNAVGVERDPMACAIARERAPRAKVHESDFFEWKHSAVTMKQVADHLYHACGANLVTKEQQQIAEKIIRFLVLQGGDCRPKDYVDDENLITDLLDEYVALERSSQDAK